MGLLSSFLLVFHKADQYAITELWILGGATYLTTRYLALQCFSEMTRHRGIFHSLAAAGFFCFSTSALGYHLFNLNQQSAWLSAFFLSFGFIIHLCLDEIYSIDFENKRLKRSFGTALKLIDPQDLKSSFGMVTGLGLMFFLTPAIKPVIQRLFNQETQALILNNLLPASHWFNF